MAIPPFISLSSIVMFFNLHKIHLASYLFHLFTPFLPLNTSTVRLHLSSSSSEETSTVKRDTSDNVNHAVCD